MIALTQAFQFKRDESLNNPEGHQNLGMKIDGLEVFLAL